MILVGQEKRLAEPVRSTRGERRGATLFAGLLLLACLLAALVYLNRGHSGSRCVRVTMASYTGGVTAEQCGAKAAAWCRAAYAAAPADVAARAVAVQCRRVGYLPSGPAR